MGLLIDLTGQRFGRLTAVRKSHTDTRKYPRVHWLCKCDCGVEKKVASDSLRSGATRSCGCLMRENWEHIAYSHGLARHPLYGTWSAMMQRCYDPKHVAYHVYGGRGITVCERWHEVRNFVTDMEPKPPGTTMDRIDNNGNYCKENCRWATKEQQYQNRRTFTTLLKENGELRARIAQLETRVEHLEALMPNHELY